MSNGDETPTRPPFTREWRDLCNRLPESIAENVAHSRDIENAFEAHLNQFHRKRPCCVCAEYLINPPAKACYRCTGTTWISVDAAFWDGAAWKEKK